MCVRNGTVQYGLVGVKVWKLSFSICIPVELDGGGGDDKRREWQPMGDRTLSSEPHEIHVVR